MSERLVGAVLLPFHVLMLALGLVLAVTAAILYMPARALDWVHRSLLSAIVETRRQVRKL